jgi:hypothetical protein
MVAQVDKLPPDFLPFARLDVCSNVMNGGKAPFLIGDKVPLLVGKNSHAKFWLSAPKDRAATEWVDLIVAGTTVHPDVKVLFSEDQRTISVQFRRQPVLELRVVSADSADLSFIDLRPIGLNIFGDNDGLHLGTNRLSSNSFKNVAYMAKLGQTA